MTPTDGRNLSGRFEDALVYAARVHSGQRRKGTDVPYVSHLLAVAGLVLEDGGSEDQAISALLHDALEDQPERTSPDEIAHRFGDEVARIVEECSDTVTHPKPPWRERKERYLEHLECADEAVLRVSCADKLHNARTILRDVRRHGDEVWRRFNAGREDQLWYYQSLAEVFTRRFPSPLSDELRRVVDDLEQEADKGSRG